MEMNENEKIDPTQMKDHETIFVLAVLMVDLYMATLTRNGPVIQMILPNVGNLLKDNPGFLERFKAHQKEILKKASQEGKIPPSNSGIISP